MQSSPHCWPDEDHLYSVRSTATLPKGFPDICFTKGGREFCWLAEIKDDSKLPSKRKLTPDEVDFHAEWRGKIYVFESVDDVLAFDRHQARHT